MNVLVSFIIVIVLVLLAIVGVQLGGLYILFGAVLPYVAIALFLACREMARQTAVWTNPA